MEQDVLGAVEDREDAIELNLDDGCRFRLVGDAAAWLRRRRGDGFHEPTLSRLLIELARSDIDGAFFDLGALHGYFSLLVAAAAPGKRDIHGFEMNPKSARSFRQQVAANVEHEPGFGRIVVRNAAIGARDEKRPTQISGFRLDSDRTGLKSQDMRFVSLDRYARRREATPGFLKVDIEGWEGAALVGMARLLRTASPVIALELHSSGMLAPTGLDRVPVVQMMLGMGYRCWQFEQHRSTSDTPPQEILDPGQPDGEADFGKGKDSLLVFSRRSLEEVAPRAMSQG